MDRCSGRRDITGIMLKTALNMIQSIKQSLETTQIQLDFNDGMDQCDWAKDFLGEGENTAHHNLLLFQQCFQTLIAEGI